MSESGEETTIFHDDYDTTVPIVADTVPAVEYSGVGAKYDGEQIVRRELAVPTKLMASSLDSD